MRLYSVCVLMLVAVGLSGCTRTPKTIGGPAGTASDLERVRTMYATKDPKVVVGSVVGVLQDEMILAVGNAPLDRFFTGDQLSVVDGEENTLAFATVIRRSADTNTVHAKYVSQPNCRAPVEGDLVVRFPR